MSIVNRAQREKKLSQNLREDGQVRISKIAIFERKNLDTTNKRTSKIQFNP